MKLLSVTFHCVPSKIDEWENYLNSFFLSELKNYKPELRFVLSTVESDFLEEGKNYNFLLFLEDIEGRDWFIKNTLSEWENKINTTFGQNVMVFTTFLNPIMHQL